MAVSKTMIITPQQLCFLESVRSRSVEHPEALRAALARILKEGIIDERRFDFEEALKDADLRMWVARSQMCEYTFDGFYRASLMLSRMHGESSLKGKAFKKAFALWLESLLRCGMAKDWGDDRLLGQFLDLADEPNDLAIVAMILYVAQNRRDEALRILDQALEEWSGNAWLVTLRTDIENNEPAHKILLRDPDPDIDREIREQTLEPDALLRRVRLSKIYDLKESRLNYIKDYFRAESMGASRGLLPFQSLAAKMKNLSCRLEFRTNAAGLSNMPLAWLRRMSRTLWRELVRFGIDPERVVQVTVSPERILTVYEREDGRRTREEMMACYGIADFSDSEDEPYKATSALLKRLNATVRPSIKVLFDSDKFEPDWMTKFETTFLHNPEPPHEGFSLRTVEILFDPPMCGSEGFDWGYAMSSEAGLDDLESALAIPPGDKVTEAERELFLQYTEALDEADFARAKSFLDLLVRPDDAEWPALAIEKMHLTASAAKTYSAEMREVVAMGMKLSILSTKPGEQNFLERIKHLTDDFSWLQDDLLNLSPKSVGEKEEADGRSDEGAAKNREEAEESRLSRVRVPSFDFEDDDLFLRHYTWCYVMAYAFHGLDRAPEAETYLRQAMARRPFDEEAIFLLSRIHQAKYVPAFKESFLARCDRTWEAFVEHEAELLKALDEPGPESQSTLYRLMEKCLDTIAIPWRCEIGRIESIRESRYVLSISPLGEPTQMPAILAFAKRMPESLKKNWVFTAGRAKTGVLGVTMGDRRYTPENVLIYPTKVEDRYELEMHCVGMPPMPMSEHDGLLQALQSMVDHAIGEAAAMRWIAGISYIDSPKPDSEGFTFAQFQSFFHEAVPASINFTAESYAAEEVEYWQKPVVSKDESMATGRPPASYEDVGFGRSSCPAFVGVMRTGDASETNVLVLQGIMPGFFAFRLNAEAFGFKEDDHEARSRAANAFLDKFEAILKARAGEETLRIIGRAEGYYWIYLDFIGFDAAAVVEAAYQTAADWSEGVESAHFKVFRPNGFSLSLIV